jgi:tRNA-dihydrouridine synthase C
MQAYQPPIYWEPIGQVRARLGIPVIANGDIWTFEDFLRCREMTGTRHFMLGRCALADPNLPFRVARELGLPAPSAEMPFGRQDCGEWIPLIERFAELSLKWSKPSSKNRAYGLNRTKQWLKMPWLYGDRAQSAWFEEVKRAESIAEVIAILRRYSIGFSDKVNAHEQTQLLSDASA